MPKGYGYDKAPKKSAAFKMKGFSYAGNSPMKGKRKQMELQAAADKKYDAMSNVNSAMGEMTMDDKAKGGTNLMETQTQYGSPVAKKAPLKNLGQKAHNQDVNLDQSNTTSFGSANQNVEPPKKSFGESFKAAMGTEIGQAAGKALVEGGVKLGINALASGKKKNPKKTVNVASGFSQMNITGRS